MESKPCELCEATPAVGEDFLCAACRQKHPSAFKFDASNATIHTATGLRTVAKPTTPDDRPTLET